MATTTTTEHKIGVTMSSWGACSEVSAVLRTSRQQLDVVIEQDVSGAIGNYLWPSGVITADYLLREHSHSPQNIKMYVCVCCVVYCDRLNQLYPWNAQRTRVRIGLWLGGNCTRIIWLSSHRDR